MIYVNILQKFKNCVADTKANLFFKITTMISPALFINIMNVSTAYAVAATGNNQGKLTRTSFLKNSDFAKAWNNEVAPFVEWGSGILVVIGLLAATLAGIKMAGDSSMSMQRGDFNGVQHTAKNGMKWFINTCLVTAATGLVGLIFSWVINLYTN